MSITVKEIYDKEPLKITVKEMCDKEQWNSFLINQHPQGHLLQAYEWGDLKQMLGGKAYHLGAFEAGQLIGTMLLYESTIPLPFPALHGLKWLYCSRGPTVVSPDSAALPALIEYAHTLASQIHAVLLRIEPDIADDNSALACWRAAYRKLGFHSNPNAVHLPRTWLLDIRPELPELFASFKTTWRQNIRVAERKGITIREAKTAADLQAYYEVYQETSERSHFFIHSLDYHKAILQAFGSQAILYLAEHEGQVLATRLLIRQGKWCWDMFAASSNQKRNLKATYLLQYRCLQWAKEQGCDYFDFRAIPTILEPGQEMWGVYEFKRGFGGFSRLHMPTQDYIYRPAIARTWTTLVELRRRLRQHIQRKIEPERAARSTQK